MRLLIVTQSVDFNNPVLGFFHRWIEEFAKHFESITVICLEKGQYNLPDNVRVFSLGKEQKKTKLAYIWNFYKCIFQERKSYDAVFVHMNQEYVLLGGLFWRVLGKKITMWRNHYVGGVLTMVAVLFSNKVFCTSKFSYTAKFKKTFIMPVGIDTDFFKPVPGVQKVLRSILFLGRISPIKNIHILINALGFLKDRNVDFKAFFYGNSTQGDEAYYDLCKSQVAQLGLGDRVVFSPAVPNYKTPAIYSSYEIFVNLTESGSLDKTIFEAMSCGCNVLASNVSLEGQIRSDFIFKQNDYVNLGEKLKKLLLCDKKRAQEFSRELREFVESRHSLTKLIASLRAEILNESH